MDIDAEWLEENILLHKLNRESHILLDEIIEIIRYQAGDKIISQNNTDRGLYILRAGSAAITQKKITEKAPT